MRILHIYKTFLNNTLGGIERVIFQIAKPLHPNITHTVLSLSKNLHKKEMYHSGVRHICYYENLNIASTSFSFSLIRDFYRIVGDTDIIHYHFPWPFADIMHLFWRIKKPCLLTYHSDIVRQKKLQLIYAPVMHCFLHSMDSIIATSPNYLSTSSVLQKYKNKVEVIPIGIDKATYPVPNEQQLTYWRQQFGARFFLFVGVMRYYKGLHILLDAVQNTNFPVLIVGAGPLENKLKDKAKKLNLSNVHFLGQLVESDKMALLNLCLAVLFPSHLRSEAFGISLLEGAMIGKPLISSEIGTGTSYINIHGETGIVVPPGDADALRHAMQLIWDNPQKRMLMGVKAALRYQELFTANKMNHQYERIYERILQEKP